jgi:hypothetical protein
MKVELDEVIVSMLRSLKDFFPEGTQFTFIAREGVDSHLISSDTDIDAVIKVLATARDAKQKNTKRATIQ